MNKALVFCCSVDHAKSLANRFSNAGVHALAVTGKADSGENREALQAFQGGDVQVLTSVILLTEGVDLPVCDTVMLARPTQSEILLKQMMGRAMRGPSSGGGHECTIIDFVDAFTNVGDVSGTSLGFMREYEAGIDQILRRPPSKNDRRGLDLALLLRVRDWLTQQFQRKTAGKLEDVLIQEVHGVLEFFDQTSGVNRAVLVRNDVLPAFKTALREVVEDVTANPERWSSPIRAASATRKIYADHFRDDERLSEEDFVSVVSEAKRSQELAIERVEPQEAFRRAVTSSVLNEPAVKPLAREIGGLVELMGLLA